MFLLAGPIRADDWLEKRAPTARSSEQKAFVLEQMRLFVASLQAIDEALTKGDKAGVAAAARPRGLQAIGASAKPPGLAEAETPEWKAWAKATRQGFDDIAAAAEQGALDGKILAGVAATMRNCISCHATYRIVETGGAVH